MASGSPDSYVLTPAEVPALAHNGEKDGKLSYWLQPKHYAVAEFHEKWLRIGKGSIETLPTEVT